MPCGPVRGMCGEGSGSVCRMEARSDDAAGQIDPGELLINARGPVTTCLFRRCEGCAVVPTMGRC
jgi:hypothetical protein